MDIKIYLKGLSHGPVKLEHFFMNSGHQFNNGKIEFLKYYKVQCVFLQVKFISIFNS